MRQDVDLVLNFSNSLLQRLKICFHIIVYKKVFTPVVIDYFIPVPIPPTPSKPRTKPFNVN